MTNRPVDKPTIRKHMRRFKILASMRTSRQLTFLHIHCQMSLDAIAGVTGISRKTIGRLLLGQRPTKTQLRILQKAVLAATIALEDLLTYERASRTGMYYSSIIHHTTALGRLLSRESAGNPRIRE